MPIARSEIDGRMAAVGEDTVAEMRAAVFGEGTQLEAAPFALNQEKPLFVIVWVAGGHLQFIKKLLRSLVSIRRRRVVERTFSWLRHNRRLMAHYEAIAMVAVHFIKLAMISVMLKRLTEPRP